ncbi:MAG TPA: tetratricopeptide repeat protein [Chthoniobacterales bacterium]
MSAGTEHDSRLKIGHVLFIDVVGYSKLLTDQQRELMRVLNEVVRGTDQFRAAEAADLLVRLPTGDGMALTFFNGPDAPVRCAIEIDRRVKEFPQLNLRMGIHSGPVDVVHDVNDRTNVAGAGINMAQRVMDCGDAGHILLSKRVADDLAQYERWQPHLFDLGACEVKHGVKVEVVSLYDGAAGNPEPPEKFKRKHEAQTVIESRAGVRRRRKLLAVSAAVLALAGTSAALWFWGHSSLPLSRTAQLAAQSENSVGVLPFKPLIAEARDPVLEMGMADTLITKLSGSGDIVVPSLTSVRSFAALDQDPLDAGRKLGVNSVLEGNVQRSGDQLRVTVRLIKVSDGKPLWSATFDEKFTSVFAVQDTISQKVAQALALRLNAQAQQRLTKRYTENVAAYQLYLAGRFHWNKFTPVDFAKSIEFFEQAVQTDPNYALAHFGLGDTYRALGMTGQRPSGELFPRATAALTKALEIDPSLADAHASLGLVHMFTWDWAAAEREARQAVALDPNSGSAHLTYAQLLCYVGRHDEAQREAIRGQELDRVSVINNARVGALLHLMRRYDEAIARLQQTLEMDPNFWIARMYLGKSYLEQGKRAEALAEFRTALESSHNNPEVVSTIGYFQARTGNQADARTAIDQLQSLSAQRYVAPYHFAVVKAGLGEADAAFEWLEKCHAERDARLSWLKVEPLWDSLRGDPRFLEMLRRVGL